MRKKIKIILLALLAVTAIYSLVASSMTRGLGVYELGVTAGLILASSWRYTAAVSVVLLVIVAGPWVLTLLKNRGLKKAEEAVAAAAAAEDPAQPAAPAPVAEHTEPVAPKKSFLSNLRSLTDKLTEDIPSAQPEQPAAAEQPVE